MKNNILIIVILIVIAFAFYFLLQNGKQGNDEGLEIEVLKEGSGAAAKNGDKVTVHYTGWLENGTKFDSSLDRERPFSFLLGTGQVIKGWDMGVLGAEVGEKRRLTIPPELGYGERGTPGGPIPPNATLIFEVELLALNE
jgi:FKBP-type peptidyl-prolyl cis-trans isomerase